MTTEDGQTMVEYLVMLAIVCILTILILAILHGNLHNFSTDLWDSFIGIFSSGT